jgi:hypothetical protein
MEFWKDFVTYLVWASLLFSGALSYFAIRDMIKTEKEKEVIVPILILVVTICYLIAYYL